MRKMVPFSRFAPEIDNENAKSIQPVLHQLFTKTLHIGSNNARATAKEIYDFLKDQEIDFNFNENHPFDLFVGFKNKKIGKDRTRKVIFWLCYKRPEYSKNIETKLWSETLDARLERREDSTSDIPVPSGATPNVASAEPLVLLDKNTDTAPSVFISYSHDSTEHKTRVAGFANDLRRAGFRAILDQHVESPAIGWLRWAQQEIEDADFVILICTKFYKSYFEGRSRSSGSKKISWEGNILNQLLYDRHCRNRGFIPVFFDKTLEQSMIIPTIVAGFSRFLLPNDMSELIEYMRKYWNNRDASQIKTDFAPIEEADVVSSGFPRGAIDFSDENRLQDTAELYYEFDLTSPYDAVPYDCCIICTRPPNNNRNYWQVSSFPDRKLKDGSRTFGYLEPMLVLVENGQNEAYHFVAQTDVEFHPSFVNSAPKRKDEILGTVRVPKWNSTHPPFTRSRGTTYSNSLRYSPDIKNSSWHRSGGEQLSKFNLIRKVEEDKSLDGIKVRLTLIPEPDGSFVVVAPIDGVFTLNYDVDKFYERKLIGRKVSGEKSICTIRGVDFKLHVMLDIVQGEIQNIISENNVLVKTSQPLIRVKPNMLVLRSPMVGEFYRAEDPGAEPFVNIGSQVFKGTTTCIIEALKAMNRIPSPVYGHIAKILVEDGQSVEYSEPLMLIEIV